MSKTDPKSKTAAAANRLRAASQRRAAASSMEPLIAVGQTPSAETDVAAQGEAVRDSSTAGPRTLAVVRNSEAEVTTPEPRAPEAGDAAPEVRSSDTDSRQPVGDSHVANSPTTPAADLATSEAAAEYASTAEDAGDAGDAGGGRNTEPSHRTTGRETTGRETPDPETAASGVADADPAEGGASLSREPRAEARRSQARRSQARHEGADDHGVRWVEAKDPEGDIEEPLSGPVADDTPSPKKSPAKRRARKGTVDVERVLEVLSGPESRLERSGEPVRKLTLELPIVLVDAIARWELEAMRRTGQRVYRERLFDLALAELPEDPDEVIEIGRSLPRELKFSETEQLGTRVRESVADRARLLRPEMKVRRIKDVYLRHVYAAALVNFLEPLGLRLEAGEEPTS